MKVLNAKAEEYKGQARMFENGTGSIMIEVRPRTKSGTWAKVEAENHANAKSDDRVQIRVAAKDGAPGMEIMQDRAETRKETRVKIKCRPRAEIEEKTHTEVKHESETEDPKEVRYVAMISVEEAPEKEEPKKRKYSSLVPTLDESVWNQHGKESTMKTKPKNHTHLMHRKSENNCDYHAAEASRNRGALSTKNTKPTVKSAWEDLRWRAPSENCGIQDRAKILSLTLPKRNTRPTVKNA